ncbi:hypothetical protein ACET8Y_21775 [Aeromonas veronii]
MSSQLIIDKIADIFGTSPGSILFADQAFSYANNPLDLEGVFFDDGISHEEIVAYLNSFTYSFIDDYHFKVVSPSDSFEFYKVENINKQLPPGIYTILGGNTSDSCVVFTGDFDNGFAQIDLTAMPEIIFAILLFSAPQNHTIPNNVSWEAVFSALGSFIYVNYSTFDVRSLYPYGLFYNSNHNSVAYAKDFRGNEILSNTAIVKKVNSSIPATVLEPALKAYSNVLLTSSAIELDFVNLHRVFEVLYAWALKKYIGNISEELIYDLVSKNGKNNKPSMTSERSMTCNIVSHSGLSLLNNLTNQDILDLFGVTASSDLNAKGNFDKWLSNNPAAVINAELIGEILYFVRCSLVHSKVTSSEIYLMGPFSSVQKNVLEKLVNIQRDILERLLYV